MAVTLGIAMYGGESGILSTSALTGPTRFRVGT